MLEMEASWRVLQDNRGDQRDRRSSSPYRLSSSSIHPEFFQVHDQHPTRLLQTSAKRVIIWAWIIMITGLILLILKILESYYFREFYFSREHIYFGIARGFGLLSTICDILAGMFSLIYASRRDYPSAKIAFYSSFIITLIGFVISLHSFIVNFINSQIKWQKDYEKSIFTVSHYLSIVLSILIFVITSIINKLYYYRAKSNWIIII